MKLLDKVQVKFNSMKEYYLFQFSGIPVVKQDKISKSELKKYLPANPVMIDCGAHDGADSVELVRILGGTLHAFEPVTEIYERLIKRTQNFSNIQCYQLALSSQSGRQYFHVSEGASDASSSLLEPDQHLIDHPETSFSRKIEVETVTLNEWAAANKIPKVDMLWLDMQGFEMQMLQASDKILKGVQVIHTEVSTKQTYKGVTLYNTYRAFLEQKGFRMVIEVIPDGWDMGNVLFVRK